MQTVEIDPPEGPVATRSPESISHLALQPPLTELIITAQPTPIHIPHGTGDQWSTLLTTTEAAARLSIGRTTLYELIDKRELQSVRIGRSRRVPLGAIEAFIRQRVTPLREGVTELRHTPIRSSSRAGE